MTEIGSPKEKDDTAFLERLYKEGVEYGESVRKMLRQSYPRQVGSQRVPVKEQAQDYLAMQGDINEWRRLVAEHGPEAVLLWAEKMGRRERGT